MLSGEYLAGFFDGEGSVSVGHYSRVRHNSHGRIESEAFSLTVSFTNKNQRVLKEMQQEFGGAFRARTSKPYSEWRIQGGDALHFLELIHPI
jgi:hypothetical protein